jgi:hypothetical protein
MPFHFHHFSQLKFHEMVNSLMVQHFVEPDAIMFQLKLIMNDLQCETKRFAMRHNKGTTPGLSRREHGERKKVFDGKNLERAERPWGKDTGGRWDVQGGSGGDEIPGWEDMERGERARVGKHGTEDGVAENGAVNRQVRAGP